MMYRQSRNDVFCVAKNDVVRFAHNDVMFA